jgi:fructose-specific phosphotransferase system IIA component
MNIVSLLDNATVYPQLEVSDKEELLEQLIRSLQSKVDNEQLDRIREAVLQRESIMSTGVGKGLAIPHGKAKGLSQSYAAFALLQHAVDYEAIDDKPVTMVFLLVGPESENSLHIKLLSRISRLMNNEEFRSSLKECSTAEQILDTFKKEEERYFGVEKNS